MLTWPALSARMSALAHARVANARVSLFTIEELQDTNTDGILDTLGMTLTDAGAQREIEVVWDEPFADELGVATTQPRMTLLSSQAVTAGILRDTENIIALKDGIQYRTVDAQWDGENVVVCQMRRNG